MIPRNLRSIAALIFDVFAAVAAWTIAYLLRFNFDLPSNFREGMFDAMPWVIVLQVAAFVGLGLYQGIWRYASVHDLYRISIAALISLMAVSLVMVFAPQAFVPRSVLLIDVLLLIVFMGTGRIVYRTWKEGGWSPSNATPVIVMGAGDASAALLSQLNRSANWRVVGLLDDNPNRQGRRIQGVKVLGPLDSLANHATRLSVSHAIVSMPGVNHSARRRAVDICAASHVKPLIVPSFEDIARGRVTVSQIRQVELDDLLGRDPVRLDSSGINDWLSGKTVMITGAGGSIGAELCRQIAMFHPGTLVLIEQGEFALYSIIEEFSRKFPESRVIPLVADVRNASRMQRILHDHAPAVIFHAAAYKHVPLMEDSNAWEAVQNNIGGTLTLAQIAIRAGVAKFVMVSTDKAVNPTNVMGATKRLAELVCREHASGATKFMAVRFGNVLGSTGSVVPKFREQIAAGGPITVTHPEIQRYFMSIPEAAQLVLQAGLMGQGGEIFVLDMGEPVKIVDLAREMIRLSGLSEQDIKIEFSGLRPGEKLFEELLMDDERTLPTPHPKLRIAKTTTRLGEEKFQALVDWIESEEPKSGEEVRKKLTDFLPEYLPASINA